MRVSLKRSPVKTVAIVCGDTLSLKRPIRRTTPSRIGIIMEKLLTAL
ncbi:MAG: hypothetical protein ACOC80_06720 [Petrotogales bacterium]